MVIAGILVAYVLPTALWNSGSCALDRDDRASSGVEMEGVLLVGCASAASWHIRPHMVVSGFMIAWTACR